MDRKESQWNAEDCNAGLDVKESKRDGKEMERRKHWRAKWRQIHNDLS